MKIVQIIPSFNVGGGELLAVRLCAEIKKQQPDHMIYLISLYDPISSIVYDEAITSGAKIITLGKRLGFDPLIPWRITNALRAIKPDVIHTHLAGLRYTLPAGIICRDAVKIHTVHNMASHETSKSLKRVHSFAFKHLNWVPVALSAQVQQSIRDVYGLNAPIVNNGIPLNLTIANLSKEELRNSLNIPLDQFIVISIGRLCAQKNHGLLIDAFNEFSKQKNNCRLIIIGEDTNDGSYKQMLVNKVNCLPVDVRSKINFLGIRSDIPELLIASDVFALSSDWEGVPLTLLEAMGYGVPIIATSVGGIIDIIESGVNGLLVSKGNSTDFANCLSLLSMDPNKASALSKNARDSFYKLYSIEKTVLGYLDLYNQSNNN